MSTRSARVLFLCTVLAVSCGESAPPPPAEPAVPVVPKEEPHSTARVAVEAETPAPPAAPAPTPAPASSGKRAYKGPGDALPASGARPKPGSVIGHVVIDGPVPEPEVIDPRTFEGCTPGDARDLRLAVDASGGIANVVITVAVPGFELSTAGKVFALEHRACRFEPHVSFVPPGATLRFTNSDPEVHDAHVFAQGGETLINLAMEPSASVEELCAKPGLLQIRCDLHPWTSSWVLVSATPFAAVTKADGSFEIHGLPAGEHELALWHERLGKLEQQVTIGDDATSEIEIRWPVSSAR